MSAERGRVAAVSRNDVYAFTKPNREEIVLVAGLGVEGDVHSGVNVRHRSRVAADPSQPNLRQVHLIQAELFEEVAAKGYEVPAGGLGENVTTNGIDLLGLPRGTILRFGPEPSRPASDSQAGEPGASGSHGAAAAVSDRAAAVSGGAAAVSGGAAAVSGGVAAVSGSAAASGLAGASADADAGVGGRTGAAAGGTASGPAPGDAGAAGQVAGPVAAVLAAAAAATLDEATSRAAAAVAAAAERDASVAGNGEDPRPAVVVAGLRNPCVQINGFRDGLLKEVLGRDGAGRPVRKAGVMGVVLRGGTIRPDDTVTVELPPGPHDPLERV